MQAFINPVKTINGERWQVGIRGDDVYHTRYLQGCWTRKTANAKRQRVQLDLNAGRVNLGTLDTLPDIVQGYIECMLWAENDESTPSGGVPLDDNYSVDDIEPESMATILEDCHKFQEANSADIVGIGKAQWTDGEIAGHNLWLSRNGHGTGFWDRDEIEEEQRNRLQASAESFGQAWPAVYRGKVYLH